MLGVSNSSITSLTGLLAISIVIGSCAVGWLSGRSIRPYYALLGAAGMTVCFAIMGIAPMTYERLAILMSLVGISAGFYIVPLQALLQYLAPPAERGRFFGTANALSFVFIAASGVLFFALRQAGVPTERMPLVCAGLALLGTIVGMMELKRIMERTETTSRETVTRELTTTAAARISVAEAYKNISLRKTDQMIDQPFHWGLIIRSAAIRVIHLLIWTILIAGLFATFMKYATVHIFVTLGIWGFWSIGCCT